MIWIHYSSLGLRKRKKRWPLNTMAKPPDAWWTDRVVDIRCSWSGQPSLLFPYYVPRQITTRSHTHVYMHLPVNLPTHNLSLSLSVGEKSKTHQGSPHVRNVRLRFWLQVFMDWRRGSSSSNVDQILWSLINEIVSIWFQKCTLHSDSIC